MSTHCGGVASLHVYIYVCLRMYTCLRMWGGGGGVCVSMHVGGGVCAQG